MLYKCIKCGKEFDQKCHFTNHLRRLNPCINKNNKIIDHDENIEKTIKNETIQTDKILSKMDNLDKILSKMDNLLPETKNDLELDTNNQNNDKLKCLICNKSYRHQSGLCKHKKQKHPNYDNDIDRLRKKHTEDIVISQIKKLLISQANKINELEVLVNISKPKNNNTIINNKTINTNSNNISNINNGTINNINIIGFGREDINKLTDAEIKDILFTRNIDPLCTIIKKLILMKDCLNNIMSN